MKDETAGVAIEEFVGLKPKMYLYLVDGNSEHKKAKDVNKNFVATISHNEYKDVLLKKKCLRHSMNNIQSKDHRIRTYEINKVSLSYFYDKIYIQNNKCDRLALVIRVNYKNTVTLMTIQKSFFVKHIILMFPLVRTAFLPSKSFKFSV